MTVGRDAVGLRPRERLEDVGEVVAAEILDERADLVRRRPRQSRARRGARRPSRPVEQRLDDDLLARAEEALVHAGSASRRSRRRSRSPPSRANASRSRRPYFSSSTCQPAASNWLLELAAP